MSLRRGCVSFLFISVLYVVSHVFTCTLLKIFILFTYCEGGREGERQKGKEREIHMSARKRTESCMEVRK